MSNIEWTDKTTNTHVGCNKVSAGCKNCYAIRMAYRLMHIPATAEKYKDTVVKHANGELNWTGVINYTPDVMQEWLTNKKPTKYFVNSMSDTFHNDVEFFHLYRMFENMHLAHWHTFQVVTKRAENLNRLEWVYASLKEEYPDGIFPLRNVIIMVSVEDQEQADKRIPLLLQAPAQWKGLSMEPLLGPVNLVKYLWTPSHTGGPADFEPISLLHWVIVGGESGKNARPMHPNWARSLRDQCKAAGVPFFFKQWGEWAPQGEIENYAFLNPEKEKAFGKVVWVKQGKHNAGRMLDGVEHNEYPPINTTE